MALYKNQIIVHCDATSAINDIPTLRNLIADFVQTVLDVTALENAVPYVADIRAVSGPDHHLEVLAPSIPEIGIKNDEFRSIPLGDLFEAAVNSTYVRQAMANIRSALTYPVDTGFFCYRAVESLLNAAKDELASDNKPKAIRELNKRLNLTEQCIEALRDIGGAARHGKLVTITSEERSAAISLTREILKRFVAHRKDGLTPAQKLVLPQNLATAERTTPRPTPPAS